MVNMQNVHVVVNKHMEKMKQKKFLVIEIWEMVELSLNHIVKLENLVKQEETRFYEKF